jgi:preprotein translocase subunit SecA
MGILAESLSAYAQPLLDATDGSLEQVNRALALAQVCWNLALLPEEARNEALRELEPSLKREAGEIEAFRRTVVVPMIRRHEEMFRRIHEPASTGGFNRNVRAATPSSTTPPVSGEKYPGTGRNAPCPCNSGKKYKK